MAYTNRIPDISRVSQSVRDKDFISISELKAFDDKLKEIIEKFASVNNGDLGTTASNIGELIRQVEYNMADAVKFAEDGSVEGFISDPNSSVQTPLPGDHSYENLIAELNRLYNEFLKLFGNDENVANWKHELNALKEEAIKAFQNKINGIFGRVAEQNAIESKEDGSKDYISDAAVKIKMNEIMRLNPDKHAFTRQIIVTPISPNTETIAFEVGELEENTLVLNMKIQNNDLYYNYNVVIDNNKVHILQEEHIKINNTYGIKLKIYKYKNVYGKNMYVFVMESSNTNTNVAYCFELNGILINGYEFGSSGQYPEDHGSYYAYREVDTTEKPDYNTVYYTKVEDTSQEIIQTHYIVYSITEDKEPSETKTYYTQTILDDGTIRYKANRFLTEFEEGVEYYERSDEIIGGDSVENSYVFKSVTHLREFEPDTVYYTKDLEWDLLKEIEIDEFEKTQGTVDLLNVDITNNKKVFETNDQILVDDIKYEDNIKYKNIDVDCAELFGNTVNAEKATKANKLYHLDDGVRFYSPYKGMLSQVRRGAKKIDGKLAISVGSKTADLCVIQPKGCLFGAAVVDEKDIIPISIEDFAGKYKLQLDTNIVTAHEVYSSEVSLFNLLRDTETGKTIDSFGQILYDNIMFVNDFRVELVGSIGDILDFKIISDGNDSYDTCCHIYYNTKETDECIFPVLHNIVRNDAENYIEDGEYDWVSSVILPNIAIAVNDKGELLYSYTGRTWTKNYKASELSLKDLYHDGKRYIGFTDKSMYISTDGFFTFTEFPINSELDVNEELEEIKEQAAEAYVNKVLGLSSDVPMAIDEDNDDGEGTGSDDNDGDEDEDGEEGGEDPDPDENEEPEEPASPEPEVNDEIDLSKGYKFVTYGSTKAYLAVSNKIFLVNFEELTLTQVTTYKSDVNNIHFTGLANNSNRYNIAFVTKGESGKINFIHEDGTTVNEVEVNGLSDHNDYVIDKVITIEKHIKVFFHYTSDTNLVIRAEMFESPTREVTKYTHVSDQLYNNKELTISNFNSSEDELIMDIVDATVPGITQPSDYYRSGYVYITPTTKSGLYRSRWVSDGTNTEESEGSGKITWEQVSSSTVHVIKYDRNKFNEVIDQQLILFVSEAKVAYSIDADQNTYKELSSTIKPLVFFDTDESSNKKLKDSYYKNSNRFGIVGEFIHKKENPDGDDISYPNDPTTYVLCGTNGIYYIDFYLKDIKKANRSVNNQLLKITDIVERGNDVVVAESLNGSLQYDEKSGIYTKNVIDDGDNYSYISTSKGVFAVGSEKGSTYLVDWLKGRIKEFSEVVLDSVLECGTNHTVYCFPQKENGLYKYDPEENEIKKENVFEELKDVKCDYGFETDDGLFIIGSVQITDQNNDAKTKEVIYFSPNKFSDKTFRSNGETETETQRTFTEILRCDFIDYCQPYDNEIIISTYDKNEQNVKYYFERDPLSENHLKFVKNTTEDTNHLYSFNSAITYNGKIYVLNGTGHDTKVKKGFGLLSRTVYDSNTTSTGTLSDNKFFDITILTEITDNIDIMDSPSMFVHGGLLFGMFINKKSEGSEKTQSETNIYVHMNVHMNVNNNNNVTEQFIKVTKQVSPLIDSIISIANKEIYDIEKSPTHDNFFVSLQESNDKSVRTIKDNNFAKYEDDYVVDKFYFDKENSGIEFGSYINLNSYFRLEDNRIAVGTTINTHQTNVVIALPEDNYLAVYDKSMGMLKTLPMRYKEHVSTSDHYVNIDERMDIRAIFIGSGDTTNYLYVLISGKFPALTQVGTTVNESQTNEAYFKLFKCSVNDLLSSATNICTLTEVKNLSLETKEEGIITQIKKEIYKDNLIFNHGIDYDVRSGLQYVTNARSVLYDNVDSIVYWNTNSASLDIVSPIIWNKIQDVDLTGDNSEHETYKDYKVFVAKKGETDKPKFYSYDGMKNTKKNINVTIDEDAMKTIMTVENGDGEKSVTITGQPKSVCRIGKITFVEGGQLPIISEITPNDSKDDELTSFKITKNPNFELPKDLCITELRPTLDGALAYCKQRPTDDEGKEGSNHLGPRTHYRLNEDGTKVSIDKFANPEAYNYTNSLQTRFGLFRWERELELFDVKQPNFVLTVRNLYFNPKGSVSTVTIRDKHVGSEIYNVFESINGVFIGVMYPTTSDYMSFSLYKMKSIPVDSSHIIYIDDDHYFEEVDSYREFVIDIQDTQFGTFMITNHKYLEWDMYGHVFRWNGDTFYCVSKDLYGPPVGMYDTSRGLFVKCKKQTKQVGKLDITDGDGFWFYDEAFDEMHKNDEYVFENDNDTSDKLEDTVDLINKGHGYFGHPTTKYHETVYGPVVGVNKKFYNFNTKQTVDVESDYTAGANYIVIRKYSANNDYKSRNLYKLAKLFHEEYELPLDVNMKVFGSILYNGLQVPISGLRVMSKPGNNQEPFTVVFSVDKDARFTRNIDTINALYAKKSKNDYLMDLNVGIITDYNTDTNKYYDHVFNISKVNLVVLSDKINDPREEEYKAKYEELLTKIQLLKDEANEYVHEKEEDLKVEDELYTILERNSDAYSGSSLTEGRNIAVNYGFNVNASGAPSEEDMKELWTMINDDNDNHNNLNIFPGDYLVFQKLEYMKDTDSSNNTIVSSESSMTTVTLENVRFDVYGINTYAQVDENSKGMTNKGILFQSHFVLDNCKSYWGALRANKAMAEYIESHYGTLKPVRRWLGINEYTNPSPGLSRLKSAMQYVYESGTTASGTTASGNPSNNQWWKQKVFFPGEQEIGHPQQSHCNANSHSSVVWPLYNKAPQTRVKFRFNSDLEDRKNRLGWWTDTFSIKDYTPTNGKLIQYGRVIFASSNGLMLTSSSHPAVTGTGTPSGNNQADTNTNFTHIDASKYIIAQYNLTEGEIGAAPCFYM